MKKAIETLRLLISGFQVRVLGGSPFLINNLQGRRSGHKTPLRNSRGTPAASPAAIVAAILAGACAAPGPTMPTAPATDGPQNEGAPAPPNVLLILADDLGWGDVSAYGGGVPTRNIDELAAGGLRMTDFYVPSPMCCPSRAALMTGRWAPRTGVPWNPAVRLNHSEITIADALRARGYTTAALGKWHLGWSAEDMPVHYGFDHYWGLLNGEDKSDYWHDDAPTSGPRLEELTDEMLARAERFITDHQEKPWFLWYSTRLPHLPSMPAYRFVGKSGAGDYGDVLLELDHAVGELMRIVRQTGQERDTLVIFVSDNGPPRKPGAGSAGPFSGFKGDVGEGGVRVPAIFYWPGRIDPGRVSSEPASTLDLFPTLVQLAGGTLPTDRVYDGNDIGALLDGTAETIPGPGLAGARELVFFISEKPMAVRVGRWKYVQPIRHDLAPALYDLATDPAETVDRSAEAPDVAAQLSGRLLSAGAAVAR